ncbi:hypothetical protein HK096_008184, partial [Nowakowskiella sp. JEL0078]
MNFTLTFISIVKNLLELLQGYDKKTSTDAQIEVQDSNNISFKKGNEYFTNDGTLSSMRSFSISPATNQTDIQTRYHQITSSASLNSLQTVSGTKLIVITSYATPQYHDELELKVGDLIVLERQFNDGWGLGVNERTSKQGYFLVRNCVVQPKNSHSTSNFKLSEEISDGTKISNNKSVLSLQGNSGEVVDRLKTDLVSGKPKSERADSQAPNSISNPTIASTSTPLKSDM